MLKIGALAKKTNCQIETIRFYERIGLMPNPDRTESGHRVYGPEHVKRLRFIRRSRELDFSLGEIRFLLQAVEEENPSCAEMEKFSIKHLKLIQDKIKELRGMEKTLNNLLTQCAGNQTPSCPLIDVLYDEAGR